MCKNCNTVCKKIAKSVEQIRDHFWQNILKGSNFNIAVQANIDSTNFRLNCSYTLNRSNTIYCVPQYNNVENVFNQEIMKYCVYPVQINFCVPVTGNIIKYS